MNIGGRTQTNGVADYPTCDYPMLLRLGRLGFKAGQDFDLGTASPQTKKPFEQGTDDGKEAVVALGKKAAGEATTGWVYSTSGGAYGVDYQWRAAIAYALLGENLPQDAVYPSLSTDTEGRPLDGRNNYILHFDKGKLPPVDAFWSVTAYDTEGHFIPNRIGRQALGDRDPLHANQDGSVDLYIQVEAPSSENEPNWLPVATAPFTLLMRLYSPREQVLTRAWTPPPLHQFSQSP